MAPPSPARSLNSPLSPPPHPFHQQFHLQNINIFLSLSPEPTPGLVTSISHWVDVKGLPAHSTICPLALFSLPSPRRPDRRDSHGLNIKSRQFTVALKAWYNLVSADLPSTDLSLPWIVAILRFFVSDKRPTHYTVFPLPGTTSFIPNSSSISFNVTSDRPSCLK